MVTRPGEGYVIGGTPDAQGGINCSAGQCDGVYTSPDTCPNPTHGTPVALPTKFLSSGTNTPQDF